MIDRMSSDFLGSDQRAQAVVALGGGHGLHASLSALRHLVDDLTVDELTAVVTVADNGGSSGRLRGEFGVLPPGDLRMALAALCGDDEWGDTWARVLQHRFAGDGEMRGHVVGNLLIVGLWELLGDHVDALDWVGRLLGAKGRVLPMATEPMDITADVRGLDPADPDALTSVRGQVEVATTDGVIAAIALEPPDPEVSPAVVDALAAADWAVLGPGSWFTSVLPHLLVPRLRSALVATEARLIVVLNLEEQAGETPGFGPADHLAVLSEHAPDLAIHTVLADRRSLADVDPAELAELEETVAALGARLVVDDVAADDGAPRHDPVRLAAAYARIFAAG
ncbi:LPPG:FO 2-phospho-L-lactate transferase like, CofD-like [Pimelobacter simplex]|uniref:Putative gluconeogenesis factor n=2 Tax=Nocardioides simplex TaxID=2045 RepID=A0A0A1DTR8_NOCSI|nr:LPPG:FO 2-phospho-L-lactate transferase like, CofD-like [Pimelobacter simplex]GEB13773.1 putative gluconeogenesis factor [Pimelobacter simplex]